MYATERQQLIARLVSEDGRVAVVDLSTRLGVTTETVRRDLAQLEEAGALRRVHGGAVAATRRSTAESSVADRTGQHSGAKRAIARRIVATLPSGGSVYLDAGTTAAAVAAVLAEREHGEHLEVVTHSMTIAHLLAGVPGVGLSAIGGRVRGLTAAAVGSATVAAIAQLHPDIAVLGTNGVSAGFGFSTPDPDEADVKRAIVAAARHVIMAADASKFNLDLLVSFAALTDADVLATELAPPRELQSALDDADVEVLLP
ncbi:DeoR/GlpR family DNA-binding transcription regulator [Microbacterium sp.]|uniref:DeoR/GlpR family DNA-binding transcription regulator n=1 Tax=Microbacterium sp. TaxID=51671 RepID=UPI003A877269